MPIKPDSPAQNPQSLIPVVIAGLFFALGVLTGLIAWHHEILLFLLIIPIAWHYASRPLSVFWLMCGYFLAGADNFPAVFSTFFAGTYFLGYVIWGLHALVLALPFALLTRYGAYGLISALLITALPPLGVIGWLSPLLIAGDLFPGSGLAGYLATLLVFFIIAGHGRLLLRRQVTLFVLLLISVYCNVNSPVRDNAEMPLWFAQNTHYGQYPNDPVAGFERQLLLMKRVDAALQAGAKLILLPENIANEWKPASEYWWKKEIDLARLKKATLLIGAAVYEGHGHWSDALIIRGADTGIVRARMPVPLGMWNPFVGAGFNAYPGNSGLIRIQGKVVAISICYEDLLVFPMAQSFLTGKPLALLSSANNWFGVGTDEPYMQNLSIKVQARLFGVPLIRALNLPDLAQN